MLRVAVLLAIAVACLAQTPPRPKIAETFTSGGGLEFHDNRGMTFFGDFVIDSNQGTNMRVENGTYKVGDTTEHYEVLERYDMKMEYIVRSSGKSEPHCEYKKENTTTLPAFWGWVQLATYEGKKEFHEVDYDVWGYKTAGFEVEVFVPESDPNTPRFLYRNTGQIKFGFEFKSFSATTPPSTDFEVPTECQQ